MRVDRRTPRSGFNRNAVAPALQQQQRWVTFLAPISGLVLSEPLASSDRQSARVLNNWFPTRKGARVRAGSTTWATLSTTNEPVESLFTYRAGSTETFFGACDGSVFDITAISDPDVVPTADITGLTGNKFSTAQIGTAGGDFLVAVNGEDTPRVYDGSSWSLISVTGVDPATFSFVWLFANRLFFIQKDTQKVWYLPVDSIGGTATDFSLAGVLPGNSPLMLGGRWSFDAGDGMDDRWVVATEDGDVAVYEGTDPSTAANWVLVGTYNITAPKGKNATARAGGDFLIATQDGIVALSQVVQKDPAALNLTAITRNIDPLWSTEAVTRTAPWDIVRLNQKNMMVVSLPVSQSIHEPKCLVVNVETGAWAVFTGWNTNVLGRYNETGYFGTDAGLVIEMERGGSDNGTNYVCEWAGPFDDLNNPAVAKTVRQARGVYEAGHEVKDKISVGLDYNVDFPNPPASVDDITGQGWDIDDWDIGIWDGGGQTDKAITTRWRSVFGNGYAIAPQLQMTFGLQDVGSHDLAFDAELWPFIEGAMITGVTSGATAFVVSINQGFEQDFGTLRIRNLTGTFQDNETIVGGGQASGLLLALPQGGSATSNIPNGISVLPEIVPNVELAQLDLTYEPGGLVV